MMRLTASGIFSILPNDSAATTTIAVARPTSPRVRNPIGLPCRSRFRPITPPASVAAPRRNTISDHSSNAVLLESALLRQTSHHVEFGVRAHPSNIGHPVGQREESGNRRDIPDIVVTETVARNVGKVLLGYLLGCPAHLHGKIEHRSLPRRDIRLAIVDGELVGYLCV